MDRRCGPNIPRWLSASAARKPACGPRWARSGTLEPVLGPAKPDPGDNALCESFFATLECELLERRRFASQVEARMACFSFIEGFYNCSSQRTSRYVIEGKRFCCAGSDTAGCFGLLRARALRPRAAGPSRLARLKSHGPSLRGCVA